MVEKVVTAARNVADRNVIDFLGYQFQRSALRARPIRVRGCRHCGASLLDGESEDDCSSAGLDMATRPPRRFYVE